MPTQPRKAAARKTSKKTEPTPSRPRSTKKNPAADASPEPTSPAALRAVQPGDEKYAPTAWGSEPGATGPVDLELPSGQLVLARKPGLQQLMVEGVLHKMDNLSALVDSKHVKKGKPGKPDAINVKSLLGDKDQMTQLLHTVDRVLCAVVLRPHVEMTPNDITRRVNGVIYADTVGLEDKMFIFNWAIGGSRDIERFRRESEAVVGSVVAGDAVADEAE